MGEPLHNWTALEEKKSGSWTTSHATIITIINYNLSRNLRSFAVQQHLQLKKHENSLARIKILGGFACHAERASHGKRPRLRKWKSYCESCHIAHNFLNLESRERDAEYRRPKNGVSQKMPLPRSRAVKYGRGFLQFIGSEKEPMNFFMRFDFLCGSNVQKWVADQCPKNQTHL